MIGFLLLMLVIMATCGHFRIPEPGMLIIAVAVLLLSILVYCGELSFLVRG